MGFLMIASSQVRSWFAIRFLGSFGSQVPKPI